MPLNMSLLYSEMVISALLHMLVPILVSGALTVLAQKGNMFGQFINTWKTLLLFGSSVLVSFWMQTILLLIMQQISCGNLKNFVGVLKGAGIAMAVTAVMLLFPFGIEPMRLVVSNILPQWSHKTLLPADALAIIEAAKQVSEEKVQGQAVKLDDIINALEFGNANPTSGGIMENIDKFDSIKRIESPAKPSNKNPDELRSYYAQLVNYLTYTLGLRLRNKIMGAAGPDADSLIDGAKASIDWYKNKLKGLDVPAQEEMNNALSENPMAFPTQGGGACDEPLDPVAYALQTFQEITRGASFWMAFAGAYGVGLGSLFAATCG